MTGVQTCALPISRERLLERAEEGKEYLTRKAQELRTKTEDYLEKAKETVGRQKEGLSAAIEAGRQAYREEKHRT